MSKKYQIFLACGLVAATTRLFAASDYVQLQQQVISNDSILKSLQQSQHAYAINQKYAGRLNNPTFNLELDNLGNSDLKDLDGPTTMIGCPRIFLSIINALCVGSWQGFKGIITNLRH